MNIPRKEDKCECVNKILVSEPKLVAAYLKYSHNNLNVDCKTFRGDGHFCLDDATLFYPHGFREIGYFLDILGRFPC